MTTGITPASTDSLRVLKGEYDRLLSERPGDERLLEILITMEEEVRRAALEIFKGAPEESSAASQLQQLSVQYVHAAAGESVKSLDRLAGALEPTMTEGIDGLLAQVWERLQVLLTASNDYREVIRGLNMLHHVRAGVILPPDDWSREISEGPGNGDWAERAASYPKLNQLLELLREHGVYADDVLVVSGTLREGQMRQESYLYLEIPRLSRTVLICNAYGEASFVYQGLMQRDSIFQETKSQMQERYGKKLIRILYTAEDLGEWRQKMAEALFFTRIETVEKGDGMAPHDGGGEQACPNPVGRKVDVREREEVIAGILEVCPTPEEWMGMTPKIKKKFKFHGKGIQALSRLVGLELVNPLQNSINMARMGQAIYGVGHEIIECEFWNVERWISEIKKICLSPELWMGMTRPEKRGFNLYGKGLRALSTLVGLELVNPLQNSINMARMGQAIYGVGHEIIECELWSEQVWIEEIKKCISTPEEWMVMTDQTRDKFKIHGKGLRALSGIIGCESYDPRLNSTNIARMGQAIYGVGHEIIECEFWNVERWISEIKKICLSPELWMGMTRPERKGFNLYGKGLSALSSCLGLEKSNPVGYSTHMALMGRVIYGDAHDIIECEFWNVERWISEIKKICLSPELWIGMRRNEKEKLKLYGKGLISLYNILELGTGNPISYSTDMARMGQAIYGVGHEIIECELWSEEVWIEEIKKCISTPEEWMVMTDQTRQKFRIHGKGLVALSRIIGCESYDPRANSTNMARMGRMIYGDHPIFEKFLREKQCEG